MELFIEVRGPPRLTSTPSEVLHETGQSECSAENRSASGHDGQIVGIELDWRGCSMNQERIHDHRGHPEHEFVDQMARTIAEQAAQQQLGGPLWS
jgi:hypothetical protein